MKIKELKKNAKNNIKHNYFRNVVFVFLCMILINGGFSYSNNILDVDTSTKEINELLNNSKLSNSEIIDQIIDKTELRKDIEEKVSSKYYDGIISTIFNEITRSGSFTFGIINGLNKLFFEEKLELTIIILMSNLVLFNISILFLKVFEISKARYFLEQRRYRNTKIDKLLYPYKLKKTLHLSYILFMKSLYKFLWNFFIFYI